MKNIWDRYRVLIIAVVSLVLITACVYASAAAVFGTSLSEKLQAMLVSSLEDTLHRDITISEVSPSLPGTVEISDLKIAKSQRMSDGVLVYVPKVKVYVDVLSLLLKRANTIEGIKKIEAIDAEAWLSRDETGKWDISDLFESDSTQTGSSLKGTLSFINSKIHLLAKPDGSLLYKQVSESIQVKSLNLDLSNRSQYVIDSSLKLSSLGDSLFKANLKYSSVDHSYEIKGDFNSLNLAVLATRLPIKLPAININNGIADGEYSASFKKANLKYNCSLRLSDVGGSFEYSKNEKINYSNLGGKLTLTDKGLRFNNVDVSTFGGKASINGTMTGWRAAEVDLSMNTKDIDVRNIGNLFNVVDSGIHVSGRSDANLTVKGALDAPRIAGDIHLSNSSISSDKLGEKLTSITGSAMITGENLSSIKMTAKYMDKDCVITGGVLNYIEPLIDLSVDFPNFDVSMISHWLPGLDIKAFKAAGKHILHATGPLDALSLSGEVKIPEGIAWGIPVKNLAGTYAYNGNQFTLPSLTAEVFGGYIVGSGSSSIDGKSVSNAYIFNIDKTRPGDMSQLASTWLPEIDGKTLVKGPFDGSLIWSSDTTKGNLFKGQLNVTNGEILGNLCSNVALDFDIRDKILRINKLVGVNNDALRPLILNAQGTVNLDEPIDMDISLYADNFMLSSLFADSDKYFTGPLDIDGRLSGTPKDWLVRGIVSGKGNIIAGLASDTMSGPVEIRKDQIAINGLEVKRGLAVYTANGNYDINNHHLNGAILVDKGSFNDVRELAHRNRFINDAVADKLSALCKDTGLISGKVAVNSTSDSSSVNGDIDLTNLKMADENVSGNSLFTYKDGMLKLDKLNINGANLQITADGSANTNARSAHIGIDGLHIPVPFVEALLNRDYGINGNVTLKGDMGLNSGDLDFKGHVLLEDGVYDGLDQISLDTAVDYSKGLMSLNNLKVNVGSSTKVSGKLGIKGREISAFDGTVSDLQLDYLTKVKVLNKNNLFSKLKGSLTGTVHLDGPVKSPNANIKGQISALFINGVSLGDGEYELAKSNSRYDVNKFNIHSPNGSLQARGFIDTSRLMNLEIVCEGIDLINATGQRDETVKGNLGLVAQVTGSYLEPIISTDFTVLSGSYQGIKFGELSCGLTVKNGAVTIHSSNIELGSAKASAVGALKFSDKPENLTGIMSSLSTIITHPRESKAQVNLTLNLSKNSLSILPSLTTAVESSQGGEEMHLKVGGTLETPIIKGEGSVKDGTIKFAGLKTPFRDINGRITLDGSKIVIDDLQAKGSEGNLNGKISINLGGSNPLALESEVYLNSLRLPQPLDVLANGKVTISNTLNKPLISGDVMLYSGVISVPVVSRSNSLASSDANAKNWEPRFNILAMIGDDIRFKSSLIGDMDLVGSVRLTGTLDAPSLEGVIDSPRGTFIYLGTRFDITEGHAEFRKGAIPEFNSKNLNPHIDLKGETTVKGIKIYLDVNGDLNLDGPMDALVTEVRSNPPLSEREIWSLLSIPSRIEAFSNAGFEEGIKDEVQTILMDQLRQTLVGGVEDVFRNSLKLDEFKVEQDVNNGYNLRLGKQYNNVFITYINGLRTDPLQGIKIDYMLKEGVSLSGQIDSKHDFRLFLDTHFRF